MVQDQAEKSQVSNYSNSHFTSIINRALSEQRTGKIKKSLLETSFRKKRAKKHFVMELQIKSGTLPNPGLSPHPP